MSYRARRVLVTGATGLVGSHLVARLLNEGAHVRATLHRRGPLPAESGIEYVRADLTRGEDCRQAVRGQHMVFMCAASTSGAAAIASTPMIHVTPNVIMNTHMLEAAYEAGVATFVWLSSTTGYPPSGERAVKEEEMFLGEPFGAYFFSGWQKRFTEVLCSMYGERLQRRMSTIVLRPTNIYGPHDDFEPATSHVTAALIRKVVERRQPIEVWGDGQEVRDLIYVDDVVEAMLRAGERLAGHVALNIGLGRGCAVHELLRLVLALDGYHDARIVFDASRPAMIPIRLVDTSKAERLLDFRPQVDLPEGLRRTIDWYRQEKLAGVSL